MRLPYFIAVSLIFLVSAGLSLLAASYAVTKIEETSEFAVRRSLDLKGHDWAEVESDGLRVILTGTAPDEATRFNALTVAGTEVDTSRVIDEMEVEATSALAPPRFSAEILRNDGGISIIGLIPASEDRASLIDRLRNLDRSVAVSDLMETADYPKPDGWDAAISYAIEALARLPRAKVSASSGLVKITAIADSQEEKQRLEQDLTRAAPPSLRIGLAISAPRPVITPFTLRYLINDDGGQFDACSAQDEKARDRIVAAAREAGLQGNYSCTIGLGEPSPRWPEAAEQSIQALSEIGKGTVTLSDADITLVAAQGTNPALFDRVVGELETALPPVFALHAVLPEPETTDASGPVEFSATRSPEGLVQLRGRLGDETLRDMVDSYARAAFGSNQVYTATRIVSDLPADWPVRVLAGLEALAQLHNGALTVTPEMVELSGISHEEDAKARIARQLSDKLGEGQEFTLMITYQPPPEPEDALPDPEVCEQQIAEVQASRKIAFEPGSTTIASDSRDTVNQIADILRDCGPIRLEIQGHTDSQGREEMNQQLSQARAQSILNELRGRRIPTSSYTAVGYGETQPIADNDTEEGREENRRIEFRLIRPEPFEANETGLEALETETEPDTPETDQTDTTASDADAEDQ
ncbi:MULTISPECIES: OmpA family protein [unclassified Ruegeria]|uniref:OmpA family protein n=1 Tax=unclassified Ruegeria TaxID=2625375 RepID=UPI0014921F0F|nr:MULTISPECIES: OmpA family protein [unclassified Ruegeria]NOD34873.1 OmpA family protein [Ruegeria sp. HKCCD7296]NOE42150.1 OmpA family protein [Ruegeria sp. HKCCD7319]